MSTHMRAHFNFMRMNVFVTYAHVTPRGRVCGYIKDILPSPTRKKDFLLRKPLKVKKRKDDGHITRVQAEQIKLFLCSNDVCVNYFQFCFHYHNFYQTLNRTMKHVIHHINYIWGQNPLIYFRIIVAQDCHR